MVTSISCLNSLSPSISISFKFDSVFYTEQCLNQTRFPVCSSLFKRCLDDTFEKKYEITKAVEDELEKAMSAYGYEIVQTLIVDVEPEEQSKRAMNEINAAARMRLTVNEKAEAKKILQIKIAEGEA